MAIDHTQTLLLFAEDQPSSGQGRFVSVGEYTDQGASLNLAKQRSQNDPIRVIGSPNPYRAEVRITPGATINGLAGAHARDIIRSDRPIWMLRTRGQYALFGIVTPINVAFENVAGRDLLRMRFETMPEKSGSGASAFSWFYSPFVRYKRYNTAKGVPDKRITPRLNAQSPALALDASLPVYAFVNSRGAADASFSLQTQAGAAHSQALPNRSGVARAQFTPASGLNGDFQPASSAPGYDATGDFTGTDITYVPDQTTDVIALFNCRALEVA